MTPYYDQDGVTLYHGAFQLWREVVDAATVDCIMADPPYGETNLAWDSWPVGWPGTLAPALKDSGSMWCFGSLRMLLERRDEFQTFKLSHEIIWEKHNGSGFMVDRFRRVHEISAHFYKSDAPWANIYKSPRFTMDATARTVRKKEKPPHWHGRTGATTYVSEDGGPRMMRSVIRVRSCHGDAINETQKPEGIVRPLLEYACPPGGTILIPFAGSGTDLVVARELGIKAIGFEIRIEQVEAAANRLRQGILFGVQS
jgi:site-specific DNA-methyltransferase (adenine-specific)